MMNDEIVSCRLSVIDYLLNGQQTTDNQLKVSINLLIVLSTPIFVK